MRALQRLHPESILKPGLFTLKHDARLGNGFDFHA